MVDITGSKIEAIAWNPNIERFDVLTQGHSYTIHRLEWLSTVKYLNILGKSTIESSHSWTLGNVESSDNSSFYFNPIHPQTLSLRNLRDCVVKGAVDLTFVRRYIENRYAYLATVL
uniref:Uncharacterized protein n=1 Tax=Leersia perrieri TaxID=77586 RepID=A0A0D9WNX5_9ORYZ